MAPTIWSDKKGQMRSAGIKDTRRDTRSVKLLSQPSSLSLFSSVVKGSSNFRTGGSMRAKSLSSSSSASDSGSDNSSDGRTTTKTTFNIPQYSQLPSRENISLELSLISDSSVSSTLPTPYDLEMPLHRSSSPVFSINDFGSASLSSGTKCCADDRLSPYSYHHTDEYSSSSDPDFNEHIISSTSNYPTVCSTSSDYHRNAENIVFEKQATATTPFSVSQLSQVKKTEGLFDIAVKTIKLVRRNQMLQRRLAQLQLETSEFIQSVLANPENQVFREKIQQKQKSEKI